MKKVRILVVDDHEVVRRGVAAILGRQAGWEVCGEASTGREALSACARLQPDIVVMDIAMPDMNGLEATRRILQQNPRTEILILSMLDSEQIVAEVFAAGARGYVLKSSVSDELLQAVAALAQHKVFFTSRVGEVVLRGYLSGESASAVPGQLTSREREIVQLVAEGMSNKEIAARLHITVKTVETHRAKIMRKLAIHSVTELVRYAIRNQIIES